MNESVYEIYKRFLEQAIRLKKQARLVKGYRQRDNRVVKEGDDL